MSQRVKSSIPSVTTDFTFPVPIPRLTTVLLLIICYVGSNIPTALYSVFRAELGFSATIQTVVFAAYAAGMVPGLVLTGQFQIKVGSRKLLVLGVLISLLAAGELAGPASVGVLLAARFLQGVSLGIVMVAGTAALHAAVPVRPGALAALWITLTGAIGCTVGPPLGGFISEASGRSTTAPFMAAVILLLLCLVLLGVHGGTRLTSRSRFQPCSHTRFRREVEAVVPIAGTEPASPALRDASAARSILLVGLTAGLSWACVGVYQSIGPTLIGASLGWTSLGALGLIVAVVLAAAGLTQVLSRNVRVSLSRRIGLACISFGALSFMGMLCTGSLVLAVLASLAVGIGQGFAYLSATKELGEASLRYPVGRRGMVVGLYFTAAYLGMSVPAISLGLLTDAWGLVPAGVTVMAVILAGCGAMAFSSNRPTRHAGQSGGEPAHSPAV